MNQTFNFQRWSLLVAKHWAENSKRYLMSLAAMMGLLFMWFVFVMYTDQSNPMAEGLQHVTYYFSLLLVGPFYASQFFKEIHSKTKGINYLLLPASTLEKFLCGLFYSVILFFVVFTLMFYLTDIIAVAAANAFHPGYNGSLPNSMQKAEVANVFVIQGNGNSNIAFYFILIFIGVQSAALLGSAYFAHYSYIKTAIALCLLFILVAFIQALVFGKLLPMGGIGNDFASYRFFTPDEKTWQIQLPKWVGFSVTFLMKYAFQPLFWVTTYYRLKEKEV